MRTFAGIAVLTVCWMTADVGTASAAWNNVFQTCCHGCRTPARSSFFAPAPSACCPTVCYQQRCCYQPYTAYKQESYYEPVTTYRTSYYWEQVTSYRYTSYYDPCTGCSQQVCTPCTSYKLRSQCNAVQSYVQRCRMVPYTAYRQSCYLEPVVSSAPACPTCPTGGCPTPGGPSPAVTEQPSNPNPARPLPGVAEEGAKTLPPQNIPNNRNGTKPSTTAPRMDRIASNSNGRLQGTIVSDDRITPKGNARIVFSSTDKQQFAAQADAAGRFRVELPAGEWTVYLTGNDGKPTYHSQINVKNSDQRLLTVVSR